MISVISSLCRLVDVLVYTGMCNLLKFLPDAVYTYVLPLMFSVNRMGSQEKGGCIYLVNYNNSMSNSLAFGTSGNYVTSSVREALERAKELQKQNNN
jgi:hypothetical protein